MIHHMLFADDSLLICRASEDQARKIMDILKIYELATGQLVNVAKSAITFGKKVGESVKTSIKAITGISKEGGSGTYLGLPECFSGSKTEILAYIYDRLKDRLSGWFIKLLSLGGKEVLIKAVAMAMPVYAMSCFKLTKKSIENLTRAMSDFWWNSLEHKRKMHLLSWTTLCLAKEQGGLGFKDIQNFNQALLAKQAWRILNYPDSLFARLFKSRYFEHTDFLSARNGPRPSYAWRSIQFGKELLSMGLRKHVGNGKTISVWVDRWIEGDVRRAPLMKNILVDLELKVSDLVDIQNRWWNLDKLHELFFEEDITRILSMKVPFDQEDYWVWLHNRNGSYSVRSGYWFINSLVRREEIREAEARPSLNELKVEVWKLPTAPKIKTFIWRALSNAIPVGELLVKRGIKMDPVCQACGFQGESTNHIIFQCSVARQVWALAYVPYPENGFDMVSHFSNFHTLILMMKNDSIPEDVRNSIPWIVWYLWKFRNGILFDARSRTAMEVVVKAKEEAEFWLLAQKNDEMKENEEAEAMTVVKKSWSAPPTGWVKGNIGVHWDRKLEKAGAAWVVRDERGKVLLHSRRAFSSIRSLEEAKYQAFIWALESFHSHHLNRIIIAIDDASIPGIVLRPKAWPNFKYQYGEIMRRLKEIEWWRLEKEDKTTNRGSFIIAQSVLQGGYLQSYVALGVPAWLRELFDNEERSSSVDVCAH